MCFVAYGRTAQAAQLISTKVERLDVLRWTIQFVEQVGSEQNIALRAVIQFPSIFPNRLNSSKVRDAHRKKASRWWQGRHLFLEKLLATEDGRLDVSTSKGTWPSEKAICMTSNDRSWQKAECMG